MSQVLAVPSQPQELPFWRRISFRLLATNLLLAVVPVVIVAVLVVYSFSRQLAINLQNELTSLAQQKTLRIEEWLASSQTTLEIVTENTNIFRDALERVDDPSRLNTRVVDGYLINVSETDPKIIALFLYDLNGRVVSASERRYVGRLVNRQPYFAASLATDDLRIEPPYFDISENALVTVATDIVEGADGQPVGVLAALLDTETLSNIMFDRTGLGETGESYLVSGENNYLLTPSLYEAEGFPQNRAYTSEGINIALGGGEGSSRYLDYRGVDVVGSYRYIPEIDSALLVEINADEGYAVINQIAATSGVVMLVAIIAAIGVGLRSALAISNPLSKLTDAAIHLASGELDKRVDVGATKNEIGVLGASFNSMADSLTSTLEQMQQANRDLKVANAKVREAARLKSEFLANMSHELRTPLNAIIGFTGIMLEGFAGEIDEEAQHMTQRVYENSKGLLSLINDILDIAKIESGRLDLVSSPFNPTQLSQQWYDRLEVLATQKGLAFEVKVDPKLPDTLYGDAERLTQIAVNLLSNAFKFTEEGGITLALTTGTGIWRIKVRDTGIGIPAHAKEYIFDEFRQVDGSSRRSYGGTGLGLAITRRFVLMMGGTISLESELGKGSEFIVTLPMRTAPANPDHDDAQPEPILTAAGA
ncbi:MAG: ATP-binding protein [Anaerolineae bacterium]|jgi:signal transduction histidine kinase|nr:ATP-binding protein [Anaerolineae bacterium]